MYLRDLVRQSWANAGLYARKDAHLQGFLKRIDDTDMMECWADYVALFRRDYYDLFDVVVPPLVGAGDKLLLVALIHSFDLNQPKELAVVRALVRVADPVSDRAVLNAILNRGRDVVKKDFLARGDLRGLVEPERLPVRKPTNVVRPAPVKKKTRTRR